MVEQLSELSNALTSGNAFLLGIALMAILFVVIFIIGIYVYISFAYMRLAQKNKQKNVGLAWIPEFGPIIVAFKAAKMHWWPWLLLSGLISPFVGQWMLLAFGGIVVYWHWKMFEAIKKPNWWAILLLVPVANVIIVGIAAWGNKKYKN